MGPGQRSNGGAGVDSKVIDQEFGKGWAAYNGDCVLVMNGLPDNLIDFGVHSPPFINLYIYSDSVADLGNSETEESFFEGYRFSIAEQYRVHKPGRYVAVHCKDTMRYMTSHGYAGLYDFPGDIIRAYEAEGFLFQRWITIWKDPVIEMQRTKTYGLLHQSFAKRAEVTRQGCADYVLIFQKPEQGLDTGDLWTIDDMTQHCVPLGGVGDMPNDVMARCVHQWCNRGEAAVSTERQLDEALAGSIPLSVWDRPLSWYTPKRVEDLNAKTTPGRNCVVRCRHLPLQNEAGQTVGYHDMMGDVIERFQAGGYWKFHSRVALTDGSYLVTFRNWRGEFESGAVTHDLKAPHVDEWRIRREIREVVETVENGKQQEVFRQSELVNEWREPITRGNEIHPDYVGLQPPTNWHDDSYYSILVWQKYASPVWFDLRGLPAAHPDAWMDINQTDVLNARSTKEKDGEKHICPLQLGLIERLIIEYTQPGEIVLSPYGGIGSEGYQAVKLSRRAILAELKPIYWRQMCKYLRQAELETSQVDLFSLAGIELSGYSR